MEIARKYLSKFHNAKRDHVEFDLSFTSFKNLMKSKKCYYSGNLMTSKRRGKPIRATDRTVDRIDSNKGYIKGNVVACCHTANKMKGTLENDEFLISMKGMKKIIKTIEDCS